MKFWLILLFFPLYSYSTHLIGGEMTYRYLGNDTFEIKLTVYRDCANGIPPFDDPASIGIFDSNNSILDALNIYITSQTNITNSIYNCIPVAPSNICYQKGEYIFNCFLPPLSGGYQISHQRCCVPGGIVNVLDAPTTGFTIYASIPDSIFSTNNSPVFNEQPFTILCVNTSFSFDHSATDLDGDSLVYSLCTPYSGATAFDPIPITPSPPPYSEIFWLQPYSLADMIGGTNPLTIDEQTGILSVTPDAIGIYSYGITVREFRNGVYLSETRRSNTLYVENSTGIDDFEIPLVTISPNPISGRSTIHIDETVNIKDARFELNDAIGRSVLEIDELTSNDFSLEVSPLPPGIYFYRMINDGLAISTGKLIFE
ncbi:MAG: T9SS type A sorting domain-containing protein [Bacteroidia bacterium]|nr:T9SS type A sorting domain-containing protein [Bacteroidia bacterium]